MGSLCYKRFTYIISLGAVVKSAWGDLACVQRHGSVCLFCTWNTCELQSGETPPPPSSYLSFMGIFFMHTLKKKKKQFTCIFMHCFRKNSPKTFWM